MDRNGIIPPLGTSAGQPNHGSAVQGCQRGRGHRCPASDPTPQRHRFTTTRLLTVLPGPADPRLLTGVLTAQLGLNPNGRGACCGPAWTGAPTPAWPNHPRRTLLLLAQHPFAPLPGGSLARAGRRRRLPATSPTGSP